MSLLLRMLKELNWSRHVHEEKTLYDLFLQNRNDDIHKWHHYFDIYEKYFAPYRGQPLTILEIGIFRGGSLRMWKRYFGPSARISGMDIDPACLEHEQDGFHIFIGDQADKNFLNQVKKELGAIDIVIDDGGHTASQQINSFEVLYPATKRIYIVEDTHSSYWRNYMDRGTASFIAHAKGKIDLLHERHLHNNSFNIHGTPPATRLAEPPVSEFCKTTVAVHFYDSMVVFEKGENKPRWHQIR